MEQGPSSGANSHSATQVNTALAFMEPKGSLPCFQGPASGP
jgi:hypothetical protein